MFKQTLLSTGLPVLSRVSILVVAVLAVLIMFSWQLHGFRSIRHGDFIDETQLRLRASSTQESGMGLEQVAALHLFGDVAANVVVPQTTEIPKTDLKLVLVGAMTDSDPQKASALIEADQQTRRFFIGDNIPGGAILHEVLSDSVVLKRGDRFETLLFPRAGEVGTPRFKAGVSQPSSRSGPVGAINLAQPSTFSTRQQEKSPRERLQRDPGVSQSHSNRQ